MRILVFPNDDGGCGNYRLKLPALALQAQGVDITIDRSGPRLLWGESWEGLKRPPPHLRPLGVMPMDYDIIVMQRVDLRHWVDAIPFMQAQGVRVVIDMDDLFDEVDDRNVTKAAYQGHGTYLEVEHAAWAHEACKLADVVTATTPPILRHYGYGHGVLLPNLVPESYLSIYGAKREKTVGWSGIVGVHPGDLESTDGAIGGALGDWTFHVVGTGVGVRQCLRLPSEPTVTGYLPFAEYPYALAEIEVGIVPLVLTAFNAAKSWLKGAEFASVGVPVIMSPTPENLRLYKLGVGLVAESRGQWARLVKKLIGDDALRYDLAERGREVMATQTIEGSVERWLTAWTGK